MASEHPGSWFLQDLPRRKIQTFGELPRRIITKDKRFAGSFGGGGDGVGAPDPHAIGGGSHSASTLALLDTKVSDASWAGAQVFYVGKHGNDARDGKSAEAAKLTIGSAITAAGALTPSSSNKFRIVIVDGGVYAESLTIGSWIMVDGPEATIDGAHTIADDAKLRCHEINRSSGIAVSKTAGTGRAIVEVDRLILTTAAIGVQCTSGIMIVRSEYASGVNGVVIGGASTGELHVDINEIRVTGTGGCIGSTGASALIVGHVRTIRATGASSDGIKLTGGSTAYLVVGLLDGSANNFCNLGTTDVLNIMAGSISGTQFVGPGGVVNRKMAQEGDLNTLGAKGSPVGGDVMELEDSADNFRRKKVLISNLPSGISQVQTSVFSFTHITGGASTGALGFTPRGALLVWIYEDGTSKAFGVGVIAGTAGNARSAGIVGSGANQNAFFADADAAAGVDDVFTAHSYNTSWPDADLDVTAFGSGGITLTWSAAVLVNFQGYLIVWGD